MTRTVSAQSSITNIQGTQGKPDVLSKWSKWNGLDDKTIRDEIVRMPWLHTLIDKWFPADDWSLSRVSMPQMRDDFATIALYQYHKLVRLHSTQNGLRTVGQPDAAVCAAQLRVLTALGPGVFNRMSKTVSSGSPWEPGQVCYGFSERARRELGPKGGEPDLFDLMVWEFPIPPVYRDCSPAALPEFKGDIFFHALVDGFSMARDYAEKDDERSIIKECNEILSKKPVQTDEDQSIRVPFHEALVAWYSVRESIDGDIEFVEPTEVSAERRELDRLLERILALHSNLPDPELKPGGKVERGSQARLTTSPSGPLPLVFL
ncbi:hypothetical protein [Paraburkholderia sediminicola]|uniref:hypothetical protein n=1 Tax=Paraburkholderia sediminicola TaxID=458836 RepID=UPI0038BD6152